MAWWGERGRCNNLLGCKERATRGRIRTLRQKGSINQADDDSSELPREHSGAVYALPAVRGMGTQPGVGIGCRGAISDG